MIRFAWIVIFIAGSAWEVYAVGNYQLTIDSIEMELFQASEISIDVNWKGADRVDISISIDSITSDYFERLSSVTARCDAEFTGRLFNCSDGVMFFKSPEYGESTVNISFKYTIDNAWQINTAINDLESSLISSLLVNLHPSLQDYEFTGGYVSGELEIYGHSSSVRQMTLNSLFRDMSLEGESVLQSVDAGLKLSVDIDENVWHTDIVLNVDKGAMYIVPGIEILGDTPGFYIELDKDPITLDFSGDWYSNEHLLKVDRFQYSHPDIIRLSGNAEIIIDDTITLPLISLTTQVESLGIAFPTYIQPLLLQTDFSELEIAGGVSIDAAVTNGQIDRMDLDFNSVYIDDKNNRFSLSNLVGNLSISNDNMPSQSSLQWQGISLYRLDFGAGKVEFASVENQVNVQAWQDIEVLGGKLDISNFSLQNIGTSDFELSIDANLTPISMITFTQAMQWPLMSGTLSGSFTGLKYHKNSLQMNGDIDIQLFGGNVSLRNLNITDIFSQYSKLSADITVNGLDLALLTDNFSFGMVEGTLNGSVNNLVLQNWQPVYFEASFITPEDDDKRHRISQKALNNLNSLGGGLSGTMSRGATRFFQSYSYGQIGLSCNLSNDVCELGGIRQTEDGFYLLTKGGLLPPWVEVKGSGKSIRWDQLIDGLKQIIQGEVRIE